MGRLIYIYTQQTSKVPILNTLYSKWQHRFIHLLLPMSKFMKTINNTLEIVIDDNFSHHHYQTSMSNIKRMFTFEEERINKYIALTPTKRTQNE